MGICINCIYLGDPKEPRKLKCPDRHKKLIDPRQFGEDFFCKNDNNAEIDFITGQTYFGSCRAKNAFEECPFFDDGSVPLFAWSSDDKTIFTLTEYPEKDSKILDENGEEIGVAANNVSLFAWINEEQIVYTFTETPLAEYDIVSINGEKLGTITEVSEEDNTITVDEIVYERLSEQDVMFAGVKVGAVSYFRDIEKDTSYIPEESEEENPEEPTNPDTEDKPTEPDSGDEPPTDDSNTEPPIDTGDNPDDSTSDTGDDDPDLPEELPDDFEPIAP